MSTPFRQRVEAIRKRCEEVQPEITAVQVGAVIAPPGQKPRTIVRENKDERRIVLDDGGQIMRSEASLLKAMGFVRRPVTLCDVIQMAKKVGYNSTSDWLVTLSNLVELWNSERDNLDYQQVRTINFIYDLVLNYEKNVQ